MPFGRSITIRDMDVVRNPFAIIVDILLLFLRKKLLYLRCTHFTSEQGSSSDVPSLLRVAGAQHILGIEQLLHYLGNRLLLVLKEIFWSKRGIAASKEMEPRKGYQVDC